jgi:hypothetical protein
MCKTCAERAGLAKQRSFVRASLSNFDLNGHPLSQSLRCILHVAAEGSGIPIFLKVPLLCPCASVRPSPTDKRRVCILCVKQHSFVVF